MSHSGQDGGVREIKGLEGGVKDLVRIGVGADGCERGCDCSPAAASSMKNRNCNGQRRSAS